MSLPERVKYETLWGQHPRYREIAPGEQLVGHFLSLAKPLPHQLCYDLGCGTGRGAAKIAKRCKVVGFDFAANCLDANVSVEFVQHDLTRPVDRPLADFAFCTDVLEHIPPEDVDAVLNNVLNSARRVYLAINNVADHYGQRIGETLHLTVQSFAWWREKLEALGARIDAEENLEGELSIFWCSLFARFSDIEHRVTLNIEEKCVEDNIAKNLTLGLQEVCPYDAQDMEIMLLCGGPSLNDFAEEILENNRNGMPAVTVNGTYNWLVEKGGRPGAQILVDARAFNRRFTEPITLGCKYLVSSQCDHALVKSLPPSQTWLWHTAGEKAEQIITEAGIPGDRYPVYGGTTVTLRALPLLTMLGFRKIRVYGFDSCLRGDAHHAYTQAENDDGTPVSIFVGGKEFQCHSWMVKQAEEFQEVLKKLLIPADVELAVYGDGLISEILTTAAAKVEV